MIIKKPPKLILPRYADPYWSNVTSLLYLDGTSGSTTFTDEKGVAWTRNGSAVISTAQSKFGGSSLNTINGTTDGLHETTSILTLGGDYTIECWAYRTSNKSGYAMIFGINSTYGVFLSSGNLNYYSSGDNLSGVIPTVNVWHHIALSRNSGTSRLFLDGTAVVTKTANWSGSTLYIGTDNASEGYVGYIDCFRVTNGIGRYPTNFTPPTRAFLNF